MGAYLVDRRATRQFRTSRRAAVNGQVCLHTAESILDLIGIDAGAENVANFIATRTDYGSYHQIGDRDSIVVLAPFEYEVWHDATRYPDGARANSRSVGISLAMRADDWPKLSSEHRGQLLRTAVTMAVDAARWYRDVHGTPVPARLLTKAESDRGLPGFIGHGHRDPKRRRDPGDEFPWDEFLARFSAEMAPRPSTTPTSKEALMGIYRQALDDVDALYLAYQGEVEAGTPEHDTRINDLRIWGRDLAVKVVRNGEDPRPTLRFLELHLAAEASK